MTALAEVRLWGTTIGAVALEDGGATASFQYDPAFVRSGIEVAPLTMPLSQRVYAFPALSPGSFHGLPGLLADSLPDRFGNALIDAWLATQGRAPESFNAVERLCYTGKRGMGALEFHPVAGPQPTRSSRLQIDRLVALASDVLNDRNRVHGILADEDRADALRDILRVGTSAGGARAKAVIAWNPTTNEVRSGQVSVGEGFQHWLLKFDGVTNNRDRELADPLGYGAIEHAYHRMATACGIRMSDCRLLEEGGRRHFMTRRFDRLPDGAKLHMQSLAAMAHFDFNQAGTNSYEQTAQVARRLELPAETHEELFLRMAFNVIARNQDDHVKNIAFLMDRSGTWSLAPAFDVTYSFQPGGTWTSSHQMTLNARRDDFTLEDFKACARAMYLKRNLATAIIRHVQQIVGRWRDYADDSAIPSPQRDSIQNALRLDPFQ